MSAGYLLVLIYSGLTIDTMPQPDLATCLVASKDKIGQQMLVKFWDNMNGSNPIPTVQIAFCVQGNAS